MSLADFKAAEHLIIVSAGTGHGKVDELIRRAGVDRSMRLTVPHFVSVGHILRRTTWWPRSPSGWPRAWPNPST